ncbi:SCP2 sterol-binding domain-containing protein [Shewanella sp. JM162201]|uniref:Ubiquinone biosynthesis accessory factor UbiT n=1 Tax=Shewanella jiangmenensis TaxID=2837387 RepID=A0ABS5UZ47_9GAMM|nr:SCP2 sterol-binding domain-containing protein [Shewanella jiangmenensis]MBT1443442.1 SCP2 sterol-binding domain-containing protein [Shewanella jiangmenensis]
MFNPFAAREPQSGATGIAARMAKDVLDLAPTLVRLPLSKVPFSAKAALLRPGLNLLLAQEINDGELDFLHGRWVGIEVTDLALRFDVSFDGNRLCVRDAKALHGEDGAAVRFSAGSKALLLIAAGKEDPDTLFFQRKLAIEGDTELGLMVKNLLLSIDLTRLPSPVTATLSQLARALQALERKAEPAWA